MRIPCTIWILRDWNKPSPSEDWIAVFHTRTYWGARRIEKRIEKVVGKGAIRISEAWRIYGRSAPHSEDKPAEQADHPFEYPAKSDVEIAENIVRSTAPPGVPVFFQGEEFKNPYEHHTTPCTWGHNIEVRFRVEGHQFTHVNGRICQWRNGGWEILSDRCNHPEVIDEPGTEYDGICFYCGKQVRENRV